jgi:hypothetical protein
LTDKEKNITVAEADKRRREGKQTAAVHRDRQLSPARSANSKRRKGDMDAVSPRSGKTPRYF